MKRDNNQGDASFTQRFANHPARTARFYNFLQPPPPSLGRMPFEATGRVLYRHMVHSRFVQGAGPRRRLLDEISAAIKAVTQQIVEE